MFLKASSKKKLIIIMFSAKFMEVKITEKDTICTNKHKQVTRK